MDKKDKQYYFIKTSDKDTIDKLMKLGFQVIDRSNGMTTFLNDKNALFAEIKDMSKIHFCNTLCI